MYDAKSNNVADIFYIHLILTGDEKPSRILKILTTTYDDTSSTESVTNGKM